MANTLSNLELAEFCNQMGMILRSGISPLEGLMLLLDDAQSEEEKSLLNTMIESMEMSGFLYLSMKESEVFPAYTVHMTQLGEETGTLDEIMPSLHRHYTREANFANMLKSSLLYPAIMLGMMALVILVLLVKVMPVFQQVFAQLGQEMTGFSAGLLQVGELLSHSSAWCIVLIACIVFPVALGRKHLPFQKKVQEQIAACRFCEGMAIALKSGITPEESLSLASKLVENDAYQPKIEACRTYLEEGESLSLALHKSEILTGTYARVTTLAEKTGSMDEVLLQIASEYEYAANHRITNAISMLEPTLVIVLSIVVGVILFSVMLPLLGVMAGL